MTLARAYNRDTVPFSEALGTRLPNDVTQRHPLVSNRFYLGGNYMKQVRTQTGTNW